MEFYIQQSVGDLKDEKATIKAILAIPGISSLVTEIISNILDKIIDKVEKTSFRIKDVLIHGEIINKLQVQNNIEKEEDDIFYDALEVQENEQNIELSKLNISCINSTEAGLKV